MTLDAGYQSCMPFAATYLFDTSCPMRLDGLDRVLQGQPARPPQFSSLERGLIWEGLETLAAQGRLKLIKQVKIELRDKHPAALARLKAFPATRMPPVNQDLKNRYRKLLARYPKLIPWDPRKDPADPWLIVAAQRYGYCIMTMETPLASKRYKPRRGIPLPDLCEDLHIPCKDLRQVANDEQWLA